MSGIIAGYIATAVTTAVAAVGGWSVVAFVSSVVISQYSAYKMRQAAAKARDAAAQAAEDAKGQQLIIEGAPSPLAVAYGRNLIGGSRVYHQTTSNFTYAANNNTTAESVAIGSGLTANALGSRNEYLFIQQAICFAGINAIRDIYINDKPILGEKYDGAGVAVYDGSGTLYDPYANSVRAHVYLDSKGYADPLMTANDASRITAKFKNTAFATCVFKLNKDEPQYSGVPAVQFFLEGMRVRTITGSAGARTMSTVRTYSNNSALCLLDYLTSTVYGLGWPDASLDLDSFYDSYVICGRLVAQPLDVTSEGALWRGVGSTTHGLGMYECNLALDSSKTLRDNVDAILGTMNNAVLLWSEGKYKLRVDDPYVWEIKTFTRWGITYNSYQAPAQIGEVYQYGTGSAVSLYRSLVSNNSVTPAIGANWADAVDAYVNDDVLIRDGETVLSWPNAQTRLNRAVVRFLNENKNFKEDTVAWPDSNGAVYGPMLAADSGVQLETEVFGTGITTPYHAMAKAEGMVRASRSNIIYSFSVDRSMVAIEPGDIIKLSSVVLNIPGDLVRINEVKPENGVIKISGTRFDANTLAWNVGDNVPTTPRFIFVDTLTQASGLSFTANDAIQPGSGGRLTWTNPADNNVIGFEIKVSTGVVNSNTQWSDIGYVTRTTNSATSAFSVPPFATGTYNVAVVSAGNTKRAPQPGWPYISISATTKVSQTAIALRLFKRTGAGTPATPTGGTFSFNTNAMTVLPVGWTTGVPDGSDYVYASDSVATSPDGTGLDTTLTWSAPYIYLYGNVTGYLSSPIVGVTQNAAFVNIYSAAIGTFFVTDGTVDVTRTAGCSFSVSGQIGCTVTINNTTGATKGDYAVTGCTSDKASAILTCVYRGITVTQTLTVLMAGAGFIRDTTPPPTPSGITVTPLATNIMVSQTPPSYTVGRGHDHTEVWSALGVSPLFAAATKVMEFTSYSCLIPTAANVQRSLWFIWVSKDGGVSAVSAAFPVLSPQFVTSDLIDGIISKAKFANTLSPIEVLGALPGSGNTQGRVVQLTTDNKLYRYTGSAWTVATDGADISAGTITGAKLVAGTITSNEIAANSISTTKLLVAGGKGTALNSDPTTLDLSAWDGVGIALSTDATAPVGTGILTMSTTTSVVLSKKIPIDVTNNYNVRLALRQISGTSTAACVVAFYDAAGAIIIASSSGATGWPQVGTYFYYGTLFGYPASTWTEYSISFGPNETAKIPATAKTIAIGISANNTGTGVQGLSNIFLVEKVTGALVVDGTITASKIQAGTITGDRLLGRTITAGLIAVDTITSAEISTGAITANELASNSVIAGKIAAGSIVAADIAAGGITADRIDTRMLSIKDAAGTVIFQAGTPLSTTNIGSAPQWENNADGAVRVPGGAYFNGGAAGMAGSIKIRLPQYFTNTMMVFTVDIFEYVANNTCSLLIGGYNESSVTWINCTARVIGNSNVEYPVYFGHDGTKCCVWIGLHTETWQHPVVSVRDVILGYSNATKALWASGWAISLDTTTRTSGTAANQHTASVIDTLPGADWSKTARRPANVAALVGTEPINNQSITLNANGTINNAGGGAVTITGLGYTGALNATYVTNTNQITDGAGLGTKAIWSGVTGTGKPQDNANYTTNTNQLTDGALLGEKAVWVNVTGTGRPADNASSDLAITIRGTLTLIGNTVVKSSGANTWDSDAYSTMSYNCGPTSGAYVSASPFSMGCNVMFGLNADPAASVSYTSIDAAFYFVSDNTVQIYEAGVYQGSYGTYTTLDYFTVAYDGFVVRYFKNGVLLKATAAVGNLAISFDSSIGTPGGGLRNVSFGMISSANWGTIAGAGKPADGATVGGTLGVNINGQITAGNASTLIAAAAITDAHIVNLNAAKITAGSLDAARIAAGSITASHIAANAISTSAIQGGAVSDVYSFYAQAYGDNGTLSPVFNILPTYISCEVYVVCTITHFGIPSADDTTHHWLYIDNALKDERYVTAAYTPVPSVMIGSSNHSGLGNIPIQPVSSWTNIDTVGGVACAIRVLALITYK